MASAVPITISSGSASASAVTCFAESHFDPRWSAKYQELLAYKHKTGHCNVPERAGKDEPQLKSLAKWVRRQRERYNSTAGKGYRTITKDEIQALEAAGFIWDARCYRKDTWKVRYKELVDFKNMYSHTIVPQRYPGLGEWVQNQRRQRILKKQGKKSTLTHERIQLLDDIEFCWNPSLVHDAKTKWEDHYQELVSLKEKYGTCDLNVVPKPERTQQILILESWIHKQRLKYDKLLNGFERGLSVQKAEKLTKLGLSWDFDRPLQQHEARNMSTEKFYAKPGPVKRVRQKTEKLKPRNGKPNTS